VPKNKNMTINSHFSRQQTVASKLLQQTIAQIEPRPHKSF